MSFLKWVVVVVAIEMVLSLLLLKRVVVAIGIVLWEPSKVLSLLLERVVVVAIEMVLWEPSKVLLVSTIVVAVQVIPT